jgi:hypothetical protein
MENRSLQIVGFTGFFVLNMLRRYNALLIIFE